jgi:hypothetical protein
MLFGVKIVVSPASWMTISQVRLLHAFRFSVVDTYFSLLDTLQYRVKLPLAFTGTE